MTYLDLVFAPVYFIAILLLAFIFVVSPSRDPLVKKYYMTGLVIKLCSAIVFGLIYQFYYHSGDTFFYFKDSLVITKGLFEEPLLVLKLFFVEAKKYDPTLKSYIPKIVFFRDSASFFVVKTTAILNLFSFSTYSCSAMLFAVISYSGIWQIFKMLCRMYPMLHKSFFFATSYAPSLVFWSSSIMKDTLTIFALCWLTVATYNMLILKHRKLLNLFIAIGTSYVLYMVKVYILMCAVPALVIWVVIYYNSKIHNTVVRKLMYPILLFVGLIGGIMGTSVIVESNEKYSFDNLVSTSQATAHWIEKTSAQLDGSTYNIGTLDLNPANLIPLFFKALVVSLYRPFLWEAKNPVMMLSALEALFYLILTLMMFYKAGLLRIWGIMIGNPYVFFALVFTVTFSFGIGVSTNNFGTLVRYKIPFIPFFLSALFIIIHECTYKPSQDFQ